MIKMHRKEIQYTEAEKGELLLGASLRKERSLASHIVKCALKQNAEYLRESKQREIRKKTDDEYIKYQFNDKPAPLRERMPWGKENVPVMSKDDLIGTKQEDSEL